MPPIFPPEVLQQFVACLDNRRDLLNIALSSRILLDIAQPYLDYCEIRTQLNHTELWNLLSEPNNPCSLRVRSLTIVSHNRYEPHRRFVNQVLRIPPGIEYPPKSDLKPFGEDYDATVESEALLAASLRRLVHLKLFRWHGLGWPILQGVRSIWEALASLGVPALDFGNDYGHRLQHGHENIPQLEIGTALNHATLMAPGRLTSLYLVSHDGRNEFCSDMRKVETFLLACPNLEIIDLDMAPVRQPQWPFQSIDWVMARGRWPRLRVLGVYGVTCETATLRRFFMEHPSLERIRLAREMLFDKWKHFDLPEDALPNLQIIEGMSSQVVALLSNGHNRPVHTILGIDLLNELKPCWYLPQYPPPDRWKVSGVFTWSHWLKIRPSPWRDLLLERLGRQRTSIKYIGVDTETDCTSFPTVDDFRLLARLAPDLKGLTARFTPVWNPPSREAQCVEIYSLFPSLEVIAGYPATEHPLPENWSALTPADVEYITALLRKVLQVCPALRSLEVDQYPHIESRTHMSLGKAVIVREVDGSLYWVARQIWETDEGHAFGTETIHRI